MFLRSAQSTTKQKTGGMMSIIISAWKETCSYYDKPSVCLISSISILIIIGGVTIRSIGMIAAPFIGAILALTIITTVHIVVLLLRRKC